MKKDQLVGSGAFRAALLLRTVVALALVLGISALMFTGCDTDGDDEEVAAVFNPPVAWTTSPNSPFDTTAVQKIAFGNNTFVATGSGATAWYSTDGINWTASSSTSGFVSGNSISGLGFGGGMFVATGGSSNNTTRAYSKYGVTWTASGTGTFNAKGVAYGNGTFVISGAGGQIAYTTDPVNNTWTVLANDETGTNFGGTGNKEFINAVVYGKGKFVAGGGRGQTIYSTNGITWDQNDQTADIFLDGGFIDGIAFSGSRFVAAGGNGSKAVLAWSDDGINWTNVVEPRLGVETEANNVAWGNGYFVAVGRNSGVASYSSDGIIWTAIEDTTFAGSGINGVVFGKDKWIIVGAGGKVAYSQVK
ncbi:MAG: hypothetical protein LBT14_04055 [Treponema sp.]|jgi:hypothetical protein|nr:hypothetical protein [Treponema sp.]